MLNKLFSLISFLVATTTGFAGGGSEVGNGGGLAEKNLTFAYLNLPRFITLCQNTDLCRLSSDEAILLGRIGNALAQEYQNPHQLVFRPSTLKTDMTTAKTTDIPADPGFFKIDGLTRLAKTGNNVGDPIYINSQLISPAMDIPLAVSVLVHELGHHQGEKDHAKLDLLGTKLQILLLNHSERSEFWNGNGALLTYQFNAVHSDDDQRKIKLTDEIILETGSDLYPLTAQIANQIQCPSGAKKGLRFYNVHGERGVSFNEHTQLLRKPEQVWYILNCNEGAILNSGNIELTLVFKKESSGRFIYQPAGLEVRREPISK